MTNPQAPDSSAKPGLNRLSSTLSDYRWALALLVLTVIVSSCAPRPVTYDFPTPIETTDQPIERQEVRNWTSPDGLQFSADFPAARLNNVASSDTGSTTLFITAENVPINPSPWYAFTVLPPHDTTVRLTLSYPTHAYHRYWPKLSVDRKTWSRIDSTRFQVAPDNKTAALQLVLKGGEKTYVAAQEIINSTDVANWAQGIAATYDEATYDSFGSSREGRDLFKITLTGPEKRRRPTIVIFSRQHPPEVTGYLAMQSFVESLLRDPRLDHFLGKYQLLIYPLLNPDGVDLGHWRHNAGGIDLNRDWAYYHQPETRQVAEDVVRTIRKTKSEVVLGLDFHSTWNDVYYTHDGTVRGPSAMGDFKDRWLAAIERGIGGDFEVNEDPGPIGKPTSMSWFRTQFNAEGITYEIGDDTPRPFIREKGKVSAEALISELLR